MTKIIQNNNSGGPSGGGVLVIASGAVIAALFALDMIGKHAAQISAGIITLFQVIAAVAVLAAAGAGWLMYSRRRAARAAEAAQPALVQVPSVQVPAPVHHEPVIQAEDMPAITAGGVHLHFPGLGADEAAEVVRQVIDGRG